MAVTMTVAELAAALRLADTPEETAQATRLHAYAIEAVTRDAPAAPSVVMNEAVRRLAGYMYDQPEAGRGDVYGNAMRNSGAGRVLMPYKVHRAGLTAEAEATPTPSRSAAGLVSLGQQDVVVAVMGQAYATTIPIPTTAFVGLSVDPPDEDNGIILSRNRFTTDTPVQAGAPYTLPDDTIFVTTTSTLGTVALIHSVPGTYTVEVYNYAP